MCFRLEVWSWSLSDVSLHWLHGIHRLNIQPFHFVSGQVRFINIIYWLWGGVFQSRLEVTGSGLFPKKTFSDIWYWQSLWSLKLIRACLTRKHPRVYGGNIKKCKSWKILLMSISHSILNSWVLWIPLMFQLNWINKKLKNGNYWIEFYREKWKVLH